MNKEEIILEVEETDKEIDVLGDIAKRYAKRLDEYVFSQIIRQNKELQAKVNQLETNIEDAIGYIKYCQTSDDDIFPVIEAEKMVELLERGKE